MRQIFVNLPITDLPASRRFFEALGFSFNPQFSNEDAACLVLSDTIYVMLLTRPRFADFVTGEIADPKAAVGVLLAISAESREEVDRLKAAALANGGAEWMPAQDHGFMYGVSFQDPDGHVWEVLHMTGAPPAA